MSDASHDIIVPVGCTLVVADACQVAVDIDVDPASPSDDGTRQMVMQEAVRILTALHKDGVCPNVESAAAWASRNGGCHVLITLGDELSAAAQHILATACGSDVKRALLHDKEEFAVAPCLFRPNNAEIIRWVAPKEPA